MDFELFRYLSLEGCVARTYYCADGSNANIHMRWYIYEFLFGDLQGARQNDVSSGGIPPNYVILQPAIRAVEISNCIIRFLDST